MQVGSRRAICNPVSGTGEQAEYACRLLEGRGFEVYETTGAEDAVRLAREAGEDGVSELAVVGGDGTINEVLRGLAAADHFGEVTLSIVPTGTANILAEQIGVKNVEQAIEIADMGETRTVDVGMADGEPFLVSCIAGLPAEASVAASSDLKARYGTLAFLITGSQEAVEFEPLTIEVEASTGESVERWSGDAMSVLVGNARKFVEQGGQANLEDGLFDVAVVEQMPAGNLVAEAIQHRLLGSGSEHVAHFKANQLTVSAADGNPITFSRDGEVSEHEQITFRVVPAALDLRVGPGYEPDPS